jgi:integrase
MKKKAWPQIKQTIKNGKPAYIADARINGTGERKFFPTKGEAEGWAQLQRIRRQNEGQASFDNSELAEFGLTVADAIKFTLEHYRKQKKSVTIPDAIKELVETKLRAGKSAQYGKDLSNRLGRLAQAFPAHTLAQITTSNLDGFLHGLTVAPGTKNTFRRDIRTLWSFAEKRGWAESKTAKHTEAASVIDSAPGVLTPDQTAALMAASTDDVLRAFHAISLFAGLRSAEVKRLDWRNVDLESGYIEVTAGNSKTRSRRLVPILDTLRAWITPIAKISGAVVSKELRTLHENARKAAGITTWPDNCMRHSFVSYRLADTGNAAQTALEAGHDQAILFRHYRELVRPADAKRFFAIAPINDDKIVEMHPAKVA